MLGCLESGCFKTDCDSGVISRVTILSVLSMSPATQHQDAVVTICVMKRVTMHIIGVSLILSSRSSALLKMIHS